MQKLKPFIIAIAGSFLLVISAYSGLWTFMQLMMRFGDAISQEYYVERSFYISTLIFTLSVTAGLSLFLWGIKLLKRELADKANNWIALLVLLTLLCASSSTMLLIFYI